MEKSPFWLNNVPFASKVVMCRVPKTQKPDPRLFDQPKPEKNFKTQRDQNPKKGSKPDWFFLFQNYPKLPSYILLNNPIFKVKDLY